MVEVWRQNGGGTESEPVSAAAPLASVADDHGRASRRDRGVDQVAVDGRECLVQQNGGVGPSGGQPGPQLLGRQALDELGRDGGRGGPLGDRAEPRRSRSGQAEQDVPLGAAHGTLVPAGAGGEKVAGCVGNPVERTSVIDPACAAWTTR